MARFPRRSSYSKFIVDTFCPELESIAAFYKRLTDEAQMALPRARMVLLKGEAEITDTENKSELTLNIISVHV